MKASTIYFSTMKFVWMKLLLGLVVVIVAAVLFVPFLLIGTMFDFTGLMMVMIAWLACVYGIRHLVMQYFGYMVKGGHVAVITESMIQQKIPTNYFEFGLQQVKEKFVSSNAFFIVDKLISGAVRQIQGKMERIGNWLNHIPGIGVIVQVLNLFISISLNYIDECCLGYTFYQKDENTFKSAAKGIVVYAQNWKKILKSAAVTTGVVLLVMFGTVISLFFGFSILLSAFNIQSGFAIIPAIFLTLAIKSSFIDSWILVKTMCTYMEIVPETTVSFDLYGKFSKMSSHFRDLLHQGDVYEEPLSEAQI